MPMVNSKMQVVGLIQIGNSEKQLPFTDHDLEMVRLIAFKVANFITNAREHLQKSALFKKELELNLLRTNLEK
jgi:GAF domain-containing protein